MIVESLCNIVFLPLNLIISFLPSGLTLPDWTIAFINLLQKALFFFPPDVFTTTISVIVMCLGSNFVWAIVEWVYKKIPGIN